MGTLLIDFVNFLIVGLGNLLSFVLSALPSSPFQSNFNASVESYLGGLAWVIPFPQIIVILEVWVSAILIYYVYQIVLRWIKAIE